LALELVCLQEVPRKAALVDWREVTQLAKGQ
jgi:hypothetical protein